MPRPSSRTDASRRRTLVVLVLTALVATLGLTGTAQAATTIPAGALFIAPSGSDSNPCTQASPCKTWQKALTSGKVFVARGGTYTRDEAFTPAAGSVLQNYPGERPLHVGKLWLGGASNWRLDGLAMTWGGALTANDHMMKITGGSGWRVTGSEIYGAKSWANLLIAGSPNAWRFDHNRVHDNYGSSAHNGVQDHNVYLNTATSTTTTGQFDHNTLYNASRGEDLKADGTGGTSGGAMGVQFTYNTFSNAKRFVLTGGTSNRNSWHHNALQGPWNDATLYIYQPQSGFKSNTWHDNRLSTCPGKYVGSSAGLVRSADSCGPLADVAGTYGASAG
jgi:hypothetical protein